MLIRVEQASDVAAIRSLTAAAFTGMPHSTADADGVPIEAGLVDALRADEGWLPSLSLVADDDGQVIGHVTCTRGYVDDRPALGLGPLSVAPSVQRSGIGSALVQSVLTVAEGLGEPLVVLLGDPAYYSRFGFKPAKSLGIDAPDPAWGDYFQALPLAAYDPSMVGAFRYAAPFSAL